VLQMKCDASDLLVAHGWYPTATLIGRANSWTRSRECLRIVEGQSEPEASTVLEQLAKLKWPEGISVGRTAIWADRNCLNESLENVSLVAQLGSSADQKLSAPGKNPFPTGTKEYAKWYRENNKEKFQEAQRKYRRKLMDARDKVVQLESKGVDAPIDSYTNDMMERLRRIAEAAGTELVGKEGE
jgi:hypothetical protein